MNKKFADNPKKDKFIKDCNEMAKAILGNEYNEDTTVKTAEGIWKDHADEDYDAKCSIFRNGLKPFSKNFGMILKEFNTVKDAVDYLMNNYTEDRTDYEVNFCKVNINGKEYELQIDKYGENFVIITGFNFTNLPLKRYNLKDYDMKNKPEDLYKDIEDNLTKPTITESKDKRTFSIIRDNETYYGQLIGTLLQSAVIAHLYHFQTSCRWCHADVEEYYENIVDLLDELCEGILEPLDMDLIYSNVIDQKDTPIDYFEELKAFCQDMKQQLFGLPEDSNYASIMDDIINLISKTLYRLKRFNYYKGESEQLTEGNVSFSKRSFSKKDRWELIGDKIINGELRINLPDNLAIPLERSILEDYTNRYENLTDQQIVDIICNDMTSGKVDWVKDYYYSKRSKKSFSDDSLQDFLDEYELEEGDEFFLIAAAPNTNNGKYEVIKERMIANQDAVDFIGDNGDDYYVSPYSITCDEKEANKLYNDYKKKYDGKKVIKNTPYSKRSFSDANGVKPAPQRFAVIFISKDNKLDCNASYKEVDQEAIDCFVPEGGYDVLDGKKYLDNLELNRMIPKCDCEAKIVPAAKVKIRGRIGHSSASL